MSAINKATGGYLFRTVGGSTKYLHVQAAEKALGKPLPPGAEVHHVNGNPADNLCCVCQIYDNPARMRASGNRVYHAKCMAFRSRKRRERIKNKGDSK